MDSPDPKNGGGTDFPSISSSIDEITACRNLCREARVVLTSLRGGPPHIARGEIAQDLMELRNLLPGLEQHHPSSPRETGETVRPDDLQQQQQPPQPSRPILSSYPRVARPFLQVIMDPRASGPHTLVALRSIQRLLKSGTLAHFQVSPEELCTSILSCKFEQTDAGADEAVEMAIADVLSLLVAQSCEYLKTETFMDAFNTVFVTRNTFVHSPALCYHFEDVLTLMVETVFRQQNFPNYNHIHDSRRILLGYLVNQLLHTPLLGGDGLDESTREAQHAHNDTRTLCLRLVQTILRSCPHWDNESLRIIQDDLCLSLLMTGQAIWAHYQQQQAQGNNVDFALSPGFISLEVLSEICSTFTMLWNTVELRNHLVSQFETILTGFYTRALVLLRKRKQPVNSLSFNANLIFDSEVEIILESLVDLLTLHDHRHNITDGHGGALETMFAFYDCNLRRSDVAAGLFVELCRCCGGTVNEDGEATLLTPSSSTINLVVGGSNSGESNNPAGMTPTTSRMETSDDLDDDAADISNNYNMVQVEHPLRSVPAHLKELCARALMGGMKCLFRDDKASEQTLLERTQRKRSIMMMRQTDSTLSSQTPEPICNESVPTGDHILRDLKSKKRLMRRAARIFNKKASRGIEFLIDSGLVSDPITPESMAKFLRNGIVVGLDKKAVGAYLGEAGKSPVAGKSPPDWERDWFHKDVLRIYCSLFRFEDQSLLDSLRMFLATFRLPGEAQQIDRILQTFSDACSQVCEESQRGRLKLFSSDPKRASDAAYLLSFSIIMLNTDRHNANIREDRKMSCEDFVKNNTDYGRDITEKGKEFPREYLVSIYESICEEEIRTEGEGAQGAMTVERWKDVLRGSTETSDDDILPTLHDAEDLTELVLEHVWKPIVSAIGALWGAQSSRYHHVEPKSNPSEIAQGNMLGVQGARLGMDMSMEMLRGVRQLGRIDIFRRIFICICDYSGLLGEYTRDNAERAWAFINSLESQAALIVAFQTAVDLDSCEDLDEDCWKRVWSMLFELRDLKLLSRRKPDTSVGFLRESDPDLLAKTARIDWTICLEKGDMDYVSRAALTQSKEKSGGLFSAFGRALFGTHANSNNESNACVHEASEIIEPSLHGKESLVIWDDGALSDDEAEQDDKEVEDASEPVVINENTGVYGSSGSKFESILIQENLDLSERMDLPVTGLERVEETRQHQISPRARVRERLRKCCDLSAIVLESRYMDEEAVRGLLHALVGVVANSHSPAHTPVVDLSSPPLFKKLDRCYSDVSVSTTSSMAGGSGWHIPLSPASEAFAEVLVCELALKNKNRLRKLWDEVLQDHYLGHFTSLLVNPSEGSTTSSKIPVDPGLEKRMTGLIRLSICAVQREDLANDVLSSWKYLLPVNDEQHAVSPLRVLDRHIGEGLWRIVSLCNEIATLLNEDGWEGLVSILTWCGKRGSALRPFPMPIGEGHANLPEDDPALQCYRSLHVLLNKKGLYEKTPCSVVPSLRYLVAAGSRRCYPQLSIASLDLLNVLHDRKLALEEEKILSSPDATIAETFWLTCWRKIVEGIAEAAEKSTDSVSPFNFA